MVQEREFCSRIMPVMATKKTVSKKEEAVRQYELVAVYSLSENEIVVEKDLGEKCSKCGFKIAEVDKWGVKSLAYDIKKENKGYYLRFVLEGGDVPALEKVLKIDDKMLRYLLIRN